jgi:hypothetical protein
MSIEATLLYVMLVDGPPTSLTLINQGFGRAPEPAEGPAGEYEMIYDHGSLA